MSDTPKNVSEEKKPQIESPVEPDYIGEAEHGFSRTPGLLTPAEQEARTKYEELFRFKG